MHVKIFHISLLWNFLSLHAKYIISLHYYRIAQNFDGDKFDEWMLNRQSFQAFKTDLRSMIKAIVHIQTYHCTTLRLLYHCYFITCIILEACQNYHGYVVKVNAKNYATYGDLVYATNMFTIAIG